MSYKPHSTVQITNNDNETNDTSDMVHVANHNDDEQSEGEACELCPICGIQAYGKVVQYGECGNWYHYDCININDNTIDTLGEDDFVCRVCTHELLYVGTVN